MMIMMAMALTARLTTNWQSKLWVMMGNGMLAVCYWERDGWFKKELLNCLDLFCWHQDDNDDNGSVKPTSNVSFFS